MLATWLAYPTNQSLPSGTRHYVRWTAVRYRVLADVAHRGQGGGCGIPGGEDTDQHGHAERADSAPVQGGRDGHASSLLRNGTFDARPAGPVKLGTGAGHSCDAVPS